MTEAELKAKLEEKASGRQHGGAVEDCPKKNPPALFVMLADQATNDPIAGATVAVSCKLKSGKTEKTTGADGIAEFDPTKVGVNQAKVTLTARQLEKYFPPDSKTERVGKGSVKTMLLFAAPLPTLTVSVVQRGKPARTFPEAVVEVMTGPQFAGVKKSASAAGIAEFGQAKEGEYTVKVSLTKQADRDGFVAPEQPLKFKLKARAPGPFIAHVDAINELTPKIELEYKVALLDRKLSDHQKFLEKKIHPDPTCVRLSIAQSDTATPFQGTAKLKCTPANVEAFTDDAAKHKLSGDLAAGIAISADKLTAAEPFQVFLRGVTAGKFKARLEIVPPTAKTFKLVKPFVEEDMGVVAIEAKVHQHDKAELDKVQVDPDTGTIDDYHTRLKDQVLPDPKEMTDEDKVKVGGLLHVQNAGHFGRAKILLKKLDAAQWPDGTDNYEITFGHSIEHEGNPGGLKFWDKDVDGVELKKVLVNDVKAADKVVWVEGEAATKKWRDVRMSVGLDRAADAVAKTPKQHGDWARFTIVKIDEVKLDYTPERNKAAAWNDAEKKFYINLKKDPDGRKITVIAKLSEELDDVPVHVMLAPDQGNLKAANWGEDLPATWVWKDIDPAVKHKDRKDRKDLLHLFAKTDSKGRVKIELVLSRFGGDKFWPGAYIQQDPHLAKYVHGHAELAKRKPVQATDSITVWRKFWYQTVKVDGINAPAFAGAEGQYTRVKAAMTAAADLVVSRGTVNGYKPKAIYPRYMVRINGGNADALVVSHANKSQFFSRFSSESDKPIKIPILVCDAQWDAGGTSAPLTPPALAPADFPVDLQTSKLVIDPPLQGGKLLAGGTWMAAEWDPAANAGAGDWVNVRQGSLAATDVSVNPNRTSPDPNNEAPGLRKVTVTLPAGVGATTAATSIWIENLVVQGADGPYLGESFKKRILAVYESDTQLKRDDFQNTIAHEIGHAFRQVIAGDPAGGVAGVPAHPNQLDLGQGNHCRHLVDKCVMYDSGPIVGSLNRYCEKCQPYLLVNDFTSIQ